MRTRAKSLLLDLGQVVAVVATMVFMVVLLPAKPAFLMIPGMLMPRMVISDICGRSLLVDPLKKLKLAIIDGEDTMMARHVY